jgi:hypothetical protein
MILYLASAATMALDMKANNKVELVDGIIVITQKGDQTYESVCAITTRVEQLAVGLDRVRLLVDFHGVGKIDMGARRGSLEAGRQAKLEKMAIFGASPYSAGFFNLLARSLRKQQRLFMARSREEALAWLR